MSCPYANTLFCTSPVRAASSEIFMSVNPITMLEMRLWSAAIHFAGSAFAPRRVPITEPAVAPLQSVSHPPITAMAMAFS